MQRQWLDVIEAMKFVSPVPATTGAVFNGARPADHQSRMR